MNRVTNYLEEYYPHDLDKILLADGFEDAFIVTFNDGERININTAIKTEKKQNQTKVNPEKTIKNQEENVPSKIILQEKDTIKFTIKFYVQIGIWGNLIDMET